LLVTALVCVSVVPGLPIAGDRTPGGKGGPGGGKSPVKVLQGSLEEITPADWSANPAPRRTMVSLDVAITDAILEEIATYGTINGWVDRYRFIALTTRDEDALVAVAALPYVAEVRPDPYGGLTAVGTWDLDLTDAVDVEESGVPGNPDRREVAQTGSGVHVAIIDTGLVHEWRELLNEARVDTSLARAFEGNTGITAPPDNNFNVQSGVWENDQCHHGVGVAGMVIGSRWIEDIEGVAPGARVIPLKVNDNGCGGFASSIVAAVEYATRLLETGAVRSLVINLSLGFEEPVPVLETALDDAIAAGAIVVAAAGNSGEAGMLWPAAHPRVISAGAVGWTRQFRPGTIAEPDFEFWWTQDVAFDPDPRRPPQEESEAWITPFSSRAIVSSGQELDVVAPGFNVVVPFGAVPSIPGLAWSFAAGTSFSSPLTAGVAALILQKNPALRQADVESILKSTALPMSAVDSRSGILFGFGGFEDSRSWDVDCGGLACDPVGAGLLQADGALAATPAPTRH
jgi:subtilisin family serine protease